MAWLTSQNLGSISSNFTGFRDENIELTDTGPLNEVGVWLLRVVRSLTIVTHANFYPALYVNSSALQLLGTLPETTPFKGID
jgi:hypothetical protein